MGILCLGTLVSIAGLHVDERQDAEAQQDVTPQDGRHPAEKLQDALLLDTLQPEETLLETEGVSTPCRAIIKLGDALRAVTCPTTE